MANIYVRSADGNNADNGSTWALAKATLAGADGIDAAGDTIWVSDNHAESTAGAIALNIAGTAGSPVRILCGDDAAEPPTALATTATITTTGNNTVALTNGATQTLYVYGLNLVSGSGASGTATCTVGANSYAHDCTFFVATTGTSSRVNMNGGGVVFDNCGVKFSAAAQGFNIAGTCKVQGGSLLSGGTSPTSLIAAMDNGAEVLFDGFDLSNADAAINLVGGSGSTGCKATFRNCKLPASWSGALKTSTHNAGAVFEMFNCDSGDTNYRYRRATQYGTTQDETTLIRTGGASDGTTGYSLKIVSNANASFPLGATSGPEIVKWNDTTGSAITATIEILFDSATNLKDDEIWMEVMYLGTSGYPLALFADDAKADVLATAADQTDSSETWTTTGMANPNTRKLNVTFTPSEKGFVHATVKLAKASTTVYYDEKMTLA